MKSMTGRLKELLTTPKDNCLACGECCRQFSWHLKASENDLERWRRLGRNDLLERVNRLGWIWVDPVTAERLPVCPFLEEIEPDTAICSIHAIKPDICRAYPTAEQYGQCLRGLQVK
ncbi:MAG: YkgJ family cysteine cluster protein [Desulfuromonadales bacterium]|nr:YkgJ family cysteine cluster protein [Desulfuromonadales bacterium]NIR33222.1 YkgJ family cysteine cluster protein [Desulfuromonadales bacterium]NIS40726.1 YkgJ family cysteine cluster protein [Desulfuromonadales bacterium]